MKNKLTRRTFLCSAATAAAAASLAPLVSSCGEAPACPTIPGIDEFGSKFGGVQIGAITYSWRNMPGGLENIISYCKATGINSVELMSGDLESYLGAPENPLVRFFSQPPPPPPAGTPPSAQARAAARFQLPPEVLAEMEEYNAAVKEWRLNVTPEEVARAKKLMDDAGVSAHIVKFSPARWSDEEIDYAFRTAKAMGAKAVCDEIGGESAAKMAPFAEKHDMFAILHNHAQYGQEGFSADPFLEVSPAVMLNFDCGHYYGSTGLNPCDFIKKYHDRIYSIHLKDKTGPATDPRDANQVWGQGEVPLAEVMLLVKKEGWPIYLDIELEYDIKPWSNQVKETKTCVQYARNILL